MTKWWHCPNCKNITDEFESNKSENCPKCRTKQKEINMKEIFQSTFYKVENKNRHHNAEEYYYYCVDTSGARYLFTSASLDEANERVLKNPEDIPSEIALYNPEQILKDRDIFLTNLVQMETSLSHSLRVNRMWLYTSLISIPFAFSVGLLFSRFF